MPKKSVNARGRRQRGQVAAGNLYRDRTTPQKTTYTKAYRRWLAWRITGFSLVGIGLAMAASHIIAHLGHLRFLPTSGTQDLLIGFPMAALLVLAGVVLAGRPIR